VPEYSYQKKEFGFKTKTKFKEGLRKRQNRYHKGTGLVHTESPLRNIKKEHKKVDKLYNIMYTLTVIENFILPLGFDLRCGAANGSPCY
jgi:DNA polymerase/3'-5' exonuclease PolX